MNEICSLKDLNSHLGKQYPNNFHQTLTYIVEVPNPTFTDTLGEYYQNRTRLLTMAGQINLTSINPLTTNVPII